MLISTFFLDLVFPFFPLYRRTASAGSSLFRSLAGRRNGVVLSAWFVLWRNRFSDYGNKKEAPSFSLGKITLMIDLAVILLGWPVFGDVDAVLYGLISTFVSVVVIDKVLYGIGAGTLAIIITSDGGKTAKSDPGKCRPGCDHFRSYRRVYRTTEKCTAVCLLQVRSLYGSGGSEKDG